MVNDPLRGGWGRPGWRTGVVVLGCAVLGAALGALLSLHPVVLLPVGALGVGAAVAWSLARGATRTDDDAPDGGRPDLPAGSAGAGRRCARGHRADDAPDGGGPVLSALSDSELCWAWRNSYFAAQHAEADPDRLDRVSRLRRGYLDEIQRRDPGGFDAWVAAGARAESNPARYWTSDA